MYFYINFFNPSVPCTCFDVFQASIGKVEILQHPANKDPKDVCTKIGSYFNNYEDFEYYEASIFVAVSPNLEIGPIIKAGTTPL